MTQKISVVNHDGALQEHYRVQAFLCNVGTKGPAVSFVLPSLAPQDRLANYRVEWDPVLDEWLVSYHYKMFVDSWGMNPKIFGEPRPYHQQRPLVPEVVESDKISQPLGHDEAAEGLCDENKNEHAILDSSKDQVVDATATVERIDEHAEPEVAGPEGDNKARRSMVVDTKRAQESYQPSSLAPLDPSACLPEPRSSSPKLEIPPSTALSVLDKEKEFSPTSAASSPKHQDSPSTSLSSTPEKNKAPTPEQSVSAAAAGSSEPNNQCSSSDPEPVPTVLSHTLTEDQGWKEGEAKEVQANKNSNGDSGIHEEPQRLSTSYDIDILRSEAAKLNADHRKIHEDTVAQADSGTKAFAKETEDGEVPSTASSALRKEEVDEFLDTTKCPLPVMPQAKGEVEGSSKASSIATAIPSLLRKSSSLPDLTAGLTFINEPDSSNLSAATDDLNFATSSQLSKNYLGLKGAKENHKIPAERVKAKEVEENQEPQYNIRSRLLEDQGHLAEATMIEDHGPSLSAILKTSAQTNQAGEALEEGEPSGLATEVEKVPVKSRYSMIGSTLSFAQESFSFSTNPTPKDSQSVSSNARTSTAEVSTPPSSIKSSEPVVPSSGSTTQSKSDSSAQSSPRGEGSKKGNKKKQKKAGKKAKKTKKDEECFSNGQSTDSKPASLENIPDAPFAGECVTVVDPGYANEPIAAPTDLSTKVLQDPSLDSSVMPQTTSHLKDPVAVDTEAASTTPTKDEDLPRTLLPSPLEKTSPLAAISTSSTASEKPDSSIPSSSSAQESSLSLSAGQSTKGKGHKKGRAGKKVQAKKAKAAKKNEGTLSSNQAQRHEDVERITALPSETIAESVESGSHDQPNLTSEDAEVWTDKGKDIISDVTPEALTPSGSSSAVEIEHGGPNESGTIAALVVPEGGQGLEESVKAPAHAACGAEFPGVGEVDPIIPLIPYNPDHLLLPAEDSINSEQMISIASKTEEGEDHGRENREEMPNIVVTNPEKEQGGLQDVTQDPICNDPTIATGVEVVGLVSEADHHEEVDAPEDQHDRSLRTLPQGIALTCGMLTSWIKQGKNNVQQADTSPFIEDPVPFEDFAAVENLNKVEGPTQIGNFARVDQLALSEVVVQIEDTTQASICGDVPAAVAAELAHSSSEAANPTQEFYNPHRPLLPRETSWILEQMKSSSSGDTNENKLKEKSSEMVGPADAPSKANNDTNANATKEFYNPNCLLLPGETSWFSETMKSASWGETRVEGLEQESLEQPHANEPDDLEQNTDAVTSVGQEPDWEIQSLEDRHDNVTADATIEEENEEDELTTRDETTSELLVEAEQSPLLSASPEFYNPQCLLLPGETSWIIEKIKATASGDSDISELEAHTVEPADDHHQLPSPEVWVTDTSILSGGLDSVEPEEVAEEVVLESCSVVEAATNISQPRVENPSAVASPDASATNDAPTESEKASRIIAALEALDIVEFATSVQDAPRNKFLLLQFILILVVRFLCLFFFGKTPRTKE